MKFFAYKNFLQLQWFSLHHYIGIYKKYTAILTIQN